MGVAEERVLAAVMRLRERGVAECCGLEIAREVQRDRKEPVVVGFAFYRALGELVKSGRLESRWRAGCADRHRQLSMAPGGTLLPAPVLTTMGGGTGAPSESGRVVSTWDDQD